MFEKTKEMGLLFDYYGELLTERQQDIFRLYYNYDLSLGEIAERHDISRQAVYDHLHRGEILLRDYEEKIQMIAFCRNVRDKVNELQEIIESVPSAEYRNILDARIEDLLRLL